MAYEITREDIWVGEIEDTPGALARKLEGVMRAEADLDFMIARRMPEKPGFGVLFLAPLKGARQVAAAEETGLQKAGGLHTLRIEGPNYPGLAAGMTKLIADAGINMRGFSGAAIGDRCVFYIAFEDDDEAIRAAQVLTSKLG